MTFDEYEKLEKRTRDMVFRMYVAYCGANKIVKIISKDWYRWLKEDFNRRENSNDYFIINS